MKRKLVLLSILSILLISCSGMLWRGNNGRELTIVIDNSFYQSTVSASSGRALAFQGKYLYIELALIEDQTGYDNDSEKLMTGSGTWVETSWGGHAIVALNLSSRIESVEATFVDVPREQDLEARALLGVDEQSVVDSIVLNIEPLCQTYDTVSQESWINILKENLESNLISLPLRPASAMLDVTWSTSIYLEDYLGDSQYLPILNTTNFISLDVDLSALQLRDVGFYCMTIGDNVLLNSSPAIITNLYNFDGSLFDVSIPTYTFTDPDYQYRYIQIQTVTLSDYTNPGYILGTTILMDSGSWDISYGILYDNTITAQSFGGSDIDIINASLPFGFQEGDLDFSILNISSTGVSVQDIDTVEKIRSYPPLFDSNWVTTDFTWTNNSFSYNTNFSPENGSLIIILARDSKGNVFIFSREQIVEIGI